MRKVYLILPPNWQYNDENFDSRGFDNPIHRAFATRDDAELFKEGYLTCLKNCSEISESFNVNIEDVKNSQIVKIIEVELPESKQ